MSDTFEKPAPEKLAQKTGLAPHSEIADRDILFRQQREEERLEIFRRTQERARLENVGLLAAGVAHDFNNLLCIILGNISLVEANVVHLPAVSERLAAARTASERACDLCRQLLKYVHRGTGAKVEFDLHLMLHDALSLLNAYTKTVKIHFSLAGEPTWVIGDIVQLRQILMNLLINAVEAMEGRDGNITISTERVSGTVSPHPEGTAPSFIKLKVRDDGKGMTAEVKTRIFEPFFTTKPTGTGIGLSAAVDIMRDHGGRIDVESEVNVGTLFTLLLPLAISARPAFAPRSKGRILIVDDWEPLRTMMARVVRSQGFDVDEAEDGDIALALHRDAVVPYIAVLLDLTMQGIDGATTLAGLRKAGLVAPIILMSGMEKNPVLSRIAPHEYARFLQKPLTADVIIAAIRAAVDVPHAV
jgi:two-component system, cell cycle sensor histidine kinase and response regulator CckA